MSNIKLSQLTSTTGLDEQGFTPNSDSRLLVPADLIELPQLNEGTSVEFNAKSGVLVWTKVDGTTLEATGFLTPSKLGTGPVGRRGNKGKRGKDGKPGREGRQGATGCTGKMGPTGPTGYEGDDGEDGLPGIDGGFGCPGPIGETGEKGPTGIRGFQGSMGRQGPGCIAGPTGPTGYTGNGDVWISEEYPREDYYLWLSYILPEVFDQEEITAKLNNINLTLYAKGNNEYQSEGIFNLTEISGGSGDYDIYWQGTHTTSEDISSFQISRNAKQLRLVATTEIEPEKSKEISGTVRVVIQDKNNTDVKGVVDATYKFAGSNGGSAGVSPLYMAVANATAQEGSPLNFTVNLSRVNSSPIQVSYHITAGTANLQDIDANPSGIITIPAGQLSGNISVMTKVDQLTEPNETLNIAITSAGALERNQGEWSAIGTITDSPATPVAVSVSNLSITETDSTQTATMRLTLGGKLPAGSVGDVTLRWQTRDDTAKAGLDYTAANGSITFSEDYEVVDIPITILGDTVDENSEKFFVDFVDVGDLLDMSSTSASITISDDDGSTGGGGGGCIVWGQPVKLPEGNALIEMLDRQDAIMSSVIEDKNRVYDWLSQNMPSQKHESSIIAAKHDTYNSYVDINNGLIQLTPDHVIMIKRNDVWNWTNAVNVLVGDYLAGYDDAIEVTSIDHVEGMVNVVDLDVEPYDNYYVNGVLVHNAAIGNQKKK